MLYIITWYATNQAIKSCNLQISRTQRKTGSISHKDRKNISDERKPLNAILQSVKGTENELFSQYYQMMKGYYNIFNPRPVALKFFMQDQITSACGRPILTLHKIQIWLQESEH